MLPELELGMTGDAMRASGIVRDNPIVTTAR